MQTVSRRGSARSEVKNRRIAFWLHVGGTLIQVVLVVVALLRNDVSALNAAVLFAVVLNMLVFAGLATPVKPRVEPPAPGGSEVPPAPVRGRPGYGSWQTSMMRPGEGSPRLSRERILERAQPIQPTHLTDLTGEEWAAFDQALDELRD